MFGMERAEENIQSSLGNIKKPDFPEQCFYSEALNAEHEVEQKEQGMAPSNGPTEAEQKNLEKVESTTEKKLDEIREEANKSAINGDHFNAFEELENQLFSQEMFGALSKFGAVVSPGGWHGKEIGKWTAKDKEDYRKHRLMDYAKGSWSPVSSSILSRQMHKEKNLAARKALREKYHNIRLAEAAINLGTGLTTGTIGNGVAIGAGLSMKKEHRRKF